MTGKETTTEVQEAAAGSPDLRCCLSSLEEGHQGGRATDPATAVVEEVVGSTRGAGEGGRGRSWVQRATEEEPGREGWLL